MDIFDLIADDEYEHDYAEDNVARYVEAERNSQTAKDNAARKAQREIQTNELRIAAAGLEPTAEAEPGFFRKFLDTLDTPKQWVQGIGASLLGHPDYENLGIIDAAKKGAEDDVYAAELLRPILPDNAFLRGAIGFPIDVASDPLSWVTAFGGGQGAKIGGYSVADDALRTLDGEARPLEIFNRTAAQRTKELIDDFVASNPAVGSADNIPEDILSGFVTAGEKKAAAGFRDAKAISRAQRELEIAREAGGAITDEMVDDIAEKANLVRQSLGLDQQQDIAQLFKPMAIRGTSPFYGISESFGRVPILGDAEFDIPGITAASEKMYDKLDRLWYGTPVKVQAAIHDGLGAAPDSKFWQMADKLAQGVKGAHEHMVRMASPFSRRIASTGRIFGTAMKRDDITEAERARGAIMAHSIRRAQYLFGEIGGIVDDNGSPMVRELSSVLEKSGDNFDNALADITRRFDERLPGSGQKAAAVVKQVQADFERMAAIETEAGVLGNTLQNYVYHIYNNEADELVDFNDPRYYKVQQMFGRKDAEDFGLKRTIKTLSEAKSLGLKPDTNLINAYSARLYWHHRILAEKEFAERMAFRYGMSDEAYESLVRQATGHSIEEKGQLLTRRAERAVDELRRQGLGVDTAKYKVAAIRTANGNTLDPNTYMHLVNATDDIALGQKGLLSESAGLAFDGSPEELKLVTEAHERYKAAHTMIPNRLGDSLFTQGGGSTMSEISKARFFGEKGSMSNLTPDELKFWNGVLPESFLRHVDESYQTYTLMRNAVNRVSKEAPKDFAKAFSWLTSSYKDMHRIFKEGATRYWPAYYVRNFMAAPWQALESASIMGQAMNPFNVYRTVGVLQGKRAIFDVAGRPITGKQLLGEMNEMGINGSMLNSVELLNTYGDMLSHNFASQAILRTLPGMKKLYNVADDKKSGTIKRALEWANIKKKGNFLDKHWETLSTFGDRLDAFGRQQLYINRRLMGDDPATAAQTAHRLLIDYQSGKTAFERNFLNNIFFFYSFSRGQATNTFLQMMRKPGALTNQLAMFNSLKEAVSGSYDYDEEEARDYEKLIRTTRGGEMLSDYVGKSRTTGKPVVLSQVGLPVEDMFKYVGAYSPPATKGTPTMAEVYQAIYKSANRTAMLTLAQTNPAIKGVLELLSQRNFFYDKPITDETLRKVPSMERAVSVIAPHSLGAIPREVWETVDDGVKVMLQGRENADGTITVSPTAMAALTYLIPGLVPLASSRLKAVAALPRIISTAKSSSSLSVTEGQRMARLISGINVSETDVDRAAIFDQRRRQEERMAFKAIPSSQKAFAEYLALQAADNEDSEDDDSDTDQ